MNKILLLVSTLLLLLGSSFGVSYNYALYQAQSYDLSSQTLTQTVTLVGSSTGTCTYVCGPQGQTCQDNKCVAADHQYDIINMVGSAGGVYTYFYPMFSQVNIVNNVSLYSPVGQANFVQSSGTVLKAGVTAVCSYIAATFWSSSFVAKYIEIAYVFVKATGTWYGCANGSCYYNVVDWCTAATTPPDFQPIQAVHWQNPISFPAYWDAWGLCVGSTANSTSYTCGFAPGVSTLIRNGPGITDTYPRQSCTKH